MPNKVDLIYRMIGFRIEIEREKKRMTQEQLARSVGLNRTSISNIELGNQRIMLHDIPLFADALGVKPHHLLKGIWNE